VRPSPNLHVHQRERNGQPQAPLHDFVEVAITRIVVIGGIAAEPLLAKEEGIQRRNLALRRSLCAKPIAQSAAEEVELCKVSFRVERCVFLARDEQRCARQVDLIFVSADQRTQGSPRLGCVRQLGRPAR
jgi:hypothetical protein